MEIDLRQLAIATLWKKQEKMLNSDKVKASIRNKTATYKFADYCSIKFKDNTITTYKKDGKDIELNTTQIIQDYCKTNGIDVVKCTRENYAIEFIPSEKAIREFKRMMEELEESDYRNIAKIASNAKEMVS